MKVWIFQALPSRYDLEKELIAGCSTEWTAYQHPKEMTTGDLVFFWRAAQKEPLKRGIYGWGRITGPTKYDERSGWWVPISYIHRFPQFIPATRLQQNNDFATHQLFRFAIGTNFPVSTREFQGLCTVIRDTLGSDYIPEEAQ